uniref:Exonuclease 3'-5' domain containing 1 n=1 Tax=Salvator merianae TaxID=96440 RepID=A0A8D0C9L6_SALMN
MDISSDCHFFHDILGKTMKITLKCGVFQGVLQHVDSSRSIFLNKVKDLESDRHIPGVKKFFGHEIVNGEYSAFSQLSLKMHFLTIASSNIMHIKKQKVCAIAAEGVNLCRYGKLSWLQVATKTHIFLFDIFLLGAQVFKNGLRMILEDKNILKVIHDCRWLSDCLAHQYGTVLSNVFDTQVADVFQFSVETGGFLPQHISTLQDCLMRYLGLSYRRIAFMEQRQHKNPEIWFVRPLPPPLLNVLALETAYLIPLRITLLDEIMSDVTTLVDGYLNVFREGSADPLGSQISCMELPQELRQLTDFQKERRQRAMQKYQLNKEGLLIRKQMESEGKMVAKKEINQSNGTDTILSNKAVPVLSISQKRKWPPPSSQRPQPPPPQQQYERSGDRTQAAPTPRVARGRDQRVGWATQKPPPAQAGPRTQVRRGGSQTGLGANVAGPGVRGARQRLHPYPNPSFPLPQQPPRQPGLLLK